MPWTLAIGQENDATAALSSFNDQFQRFKDVIREIEQQRIDFQQANQASREQLNGELQESLQRGQEIIEQMVPLAIEAYRSNTKSPDLTRFLATAAQHYAAGISLPTAGEAGLGGDQYEQALPIIQALSEGGCEETDLPLWGVVSAFALNDYDLAEEYLRQAIQSQALTRPDEISDSVQRRLAELVWSVMGLLSEYRTLWPEEQAIRQQEAEADDLPRVKLTTTKGDIVLELFENEAPDTVASFLSLVKDGFYEGLTFHRVVPGLAAQGGCPEGTGAGGPGYRLACECDEPDHRKHFRGSLSMAHAGRDTGGSQFFITFVPTGHLNGVHTVFGRVLEGMDVVTDFQRRMPKGNPDADQGLPAPDKILKATVIRDRGHTYEFPRLPAS